MMKSQATDISEVLKTAYDYIIIGTGMGGGTIGLALAEKGKKVLFIDRGLLNKSNEAIGFPEEKISLGRAVEDQDEALLKNYGRCTQKIRDVSYGLNTEFIPLLGEGAGGSSTLYGAAFERFFAEDFHLTRYHKGPHASAVKDWPIQYSDLEDYYTKAEKLYAVRGDRDPLRSEQKSLPPLPFRPWTGIGEKISNNLKSKGLHPYALPVGHIDWTNRKCPGCQGTLCPHHEKADSFNSAIQIALHKYGAHFLESADVQSLQADDKKVTAVIVRIAGKDYEINGAKYILSAGAVFTPALLLKSKTQYWPNGLGNSNGLVGRYLCRHYMDLVTLKKTMGLLSKHELAEKELAMNDFYLCKEGKFGTVQSLGNNPPGRAVISELVAELKSEKKWLRYLGFSLLCLLPFAHKLADFVLKGINMALIMEDLSSYENRVFIDSDGMVAIKYEISKEEHQRLQIFRQKVLQAFKDFRPVLQPQGENNQRLAHASGTCRMGEDPQSSVVDPSNRVHGVQNLYIVDSSFFTTSSGINPSLTIAANALRVADILEPVV